MSKKNNGFSFKQFHIQHELCAMKVGTDGILLGAWADISPVSERPLSVLDIGTGSGLVSLMLAQRCQGNLQALAIDIDSSACAQARINVAASPWPDAIVVEHIALQVLSQPTVSTDPVLSHNQQFELIVSNPPYFVHGQTFADNARQTARHTGSLTHQQLIDHALPLLAPHGRIVLVLPYESGQQVIRYCQQLGGLSLNCLQVKTTPNKPCKRMLLCITRGDNKLQQQALSIHVESGCYTKEFIALTASFYLKM